MRLVNLDILAPLRPSRAARPEADMYLVNLDILASLRPSLARCPPRGLMEARYRTTTKWVLRSYGRAQGLGEDTPSIRCPTISVPAVVILSITRRFSRLMVENRTHPSLGTEYVDAPPLRYIKLIRALSH